MVVVQMDNNLQTQVLMAQPIKVTLVAMVLIMAAQIMLEVAEAVLVVLLLILLMAMVV